MLITLFKLITSKYQLSSFISIFTIFVQLVAPKRKRLEEAEAELSVIVKHLNTKRAELNVILSKFQALNDDFTAKTTKKEVSIFYCVFI